MKEKRFEGIGYEFRAKSYWDPLMQPPPSSNGPNCDAGSSFLNTVPNSGSSLWKSLMLRFG
jgi:hypothetical protein